MIESQFNELLAAVERVKREVMEILEGEEKQALKQAEGIRVHLEHRCLELKKTQAQVEKLSKNKNDVDFLQVRDIKHLLGSVCGKEAASSLIPLFRPPGIFRVEERSGRHFPARGLHRPDGPPQLLQPRHRRLHTGALLHARVVLPGEGQGDVQKR